jgi:hypothetical protein
MELFLRLMIVSSLRPPAQTMNSPEVRETVEVADPLPAGS